MKRPFLLAIFLTIFTSGSEGQINVPDVDHSISGERMRQVYDEVKTPFKYGVVIRGEKDQLVDCPSVFRQGDEWYMVYVGNTRKVGYETFLARSGDLLHWAKTGKDPGLPARRMGSLAG